MSQVEANLSGPPVEPSARAVRRARPRTWLARAAFGTLGRTGAQIGLAWIVVVAFCAVFAPLLANSHPLLIRYTAGEHSGRWAMPFLEHLSAADVILLVGFLAAAAMLAVWRLMWSTRVLAWGVLLATLVPLVAWPSVSGGLQELARQNHPDLLAWLERWTSTPRVYAVNAVVLVMGAAALIAALWRAVGPAWGKVLAGLVFVAATLPFAWVQVQPPRILVGGYEEWREAEAAGEVEVLLTAPLPFSPSDRLRDQFDVDRPHPQAPSWTHPLGTESFGSDILSQMIWASRIAMTIGFISTGIAVIIGVIIGGLMGYFAGLVDLLGMRLVEVFSAIPTLYLLLAFVAFFGRSLYMIMAIIGLTSWVGYALFTRAEFLKLRKQDFVQAGIALGLPLRSILFKHILRNALAPILVNVSFGVASAILAEAYLSFLGLGVDDSPSWGGLLDQATTATGGFRWWLAIYPGLAIFITVFAYNLIGEALRDAVDVRG